MSVYPAVVLPRSTTILCDADLVEVVRKGCGSDVADVLQNRLVNDFETKESIASLKEILALLQGAIISAENAEGALEDLLGERC